MKNLIIFFLVIIIYSCNTKEYYTLNDYNNTHVKFAKKQIIDKRLDFIISIPLKYDIEIKENISEKILLSFDAKSKINGPKSWISIQKIKGHKKNVTLKSEFEHCAFILEDFSGVKILESGISTVLNYDSYFIHTNPETEDYGKTDFLFFILESDQNDAFYNISLVSSKTENLKVDMSVLLSCLKTFENKNR